MKRTIHHRLSWPLDRRLLQLETPRPCRWVSLPYCWWRVFIADECSADEEALEAVANGGSMDLYVWIRDYKMPWITRD
jgi:hypothetical protein